MWTSSARLGDLTDGVSNHIYRVFKSSKKHTKLMD